MSCSSTVGSLGRPAFPARIAVHPPAAVGCVPDSDFGVAGHVTCGRKIASATIAESTDGVLLPWHTTPHLHRSCRLHLDNLPPFTRIAYPPPRHASTHFVRPVLDLPASHRTGAQACRHSPVKPCVTGHHRIEREGARRIFLLRRPQASAILAQTCRIARPASIAILAYERASEEPSCASSYTVPSLAALSRFSALVPVDFTSTLRPSSRCHRTLHASV